MHSSADAVLGPAIPVAGVRQAEVAPLVGWVADASPLAAVAPASAAGAAVLALAVRRVAGATPLGVVLTVWAAQVAARAAVLVGLRNAAQGRRASPLLWGPPGEARGAAEGLRALGPAGPGRTRNPDSGAGQPPDRRAVDALGPRLNFPGASALATARAIDDVYFRPFASALQQVGAAEQRRAAIVVVGEVRAHDVTHRRTAALCVAALRLIGIMAVDPVLRAGKLLPAGPAPDQVTARPMVKPLHTYTLWLNSLRAIVRVPSPSPRAKLHCREPSPRGG